ncbi:Muniscin C-terminal mu homology domain-containing protein [Plectosphaerella cucumerina]|uniref:Muniscin C-terminal mu homology domain-containing protein n=1 Tax=Plectosphaerella cucumerina TaxID=40658 RepID=A0A8K0TAB3_9PEZI|nr:Muniscin C-terminal mu homology domain-containing protein [Plectosphaerella cucumerina]
MDDASHSEYPSMLDNLQPTQAVTVFTERVKRINKINLEIADWLQERRRVEEQYILSLRKLAQFKVPNHQSELGVFQAPWDRILQSIEATAQSHHLLAARIDKDVETPLRTFQNKPEMQNINATAGNLASMARDLEDAQKKVESLHRKGGKGAAQKMDAASSRLTTAQQQWDSSAPFIFESLQAIDEQRINQLRDLLTQYQTHENDQAQRAQNTAVDTLAAMLEVSTELEIGSFRERVVAGRPQLEKRTSTTRQPSRAGTSQSQTLAPPGQIPDDTTSERSVPAPESRLQVPPEPKPQLKPEKTESKLRSKLGTMLGRRRQSIHGGSIGLSPSKPSSTFSRTSSSHGRPGLSPRTSTSNLGEANNRLSSLVETPDTPTGAGLAATRSHDGTNGTGEASERAPSHAGVGVNGIDADASDVRAPAGPPPAQQPQLERKDSEGFTVPPPANDPISQAQREAAETETEQPFKLNIADTPIAEEDPEASQAAISNVASTLGKMSTPGRKMGTIRGRRDVRNTIYVPSPSTMPTGNSELTNDNPFPASPPLQAQVTGGSAVAALASQASIAATSDTQSIRSANSLGGLANFKHPEMRDEGLNSSIIETVSATFEDGVVKSAKINGEIAFSYHAESGAPERETIRINNFANLEAIGPNRIFVHNVAQERPDEFTLDLSHLGKTSAAFTYRVHATEEDSTLLAEHAPLLLHPVWKPQGDKLGLLLQYSLNPASKLTAPVTLHNLVFVATYEGARASGAQTKPSGTHLKEKQLVYWRVGDVTLTSETQKIICRIIGAENGEPLPGHVEARWEYTPSDNVALGSGISIARQEESKGKEKELSEDDPFADEALAQPDHRWVDVPLTRKVVSGKYEAK